MCSEGKCCCLKLETGTLIFGVIASVLNALSILAAIGGLIALNVEASRPQQSYSYDYMGNSMSIGYTISSRVRPEIVIGGNVGLVFALLKSVMDFTFTVLLCTGVTKRKPSHLKAYFIYGIVMAVLNSIAIVILAVVVQLFFLVFGTVGIILYGLILHMIKLTHEKMSCGGVVYGFEHKPLEETIN